MLPLHRIPVWTLAERRRFLGSFRQDLERYFAVVTYEAFPFRVVESEEAIQLRRSLEARSPRCSRILAAAELAPLVRQGSGAGLGEVTRVNLVDAAFQLDRFDLTRKDLLRLFDAAEVMHAHEVRSAWLRLANPFYWLDMGLSVVEVLPFLSLRPVGKDPGRAALTPAGAVVRGGVRLLALAALAWALLLALGLWEEAVSLSHGLIFRIVGMVGGGEKL
jgi:hypothetical protein